MDELFECDAIELAATIKAGDVTPEEMLTASLARAERLNPSLQAIVHIQMQKAKELIVGTSPEAPL